MIRFVCNYSPSVAVNQRGNSSQQPRRSRESSSVFLLLVVATLNLTCAYRMQEKEEFYKTQVGRSVLDGVADVTIFHERTPTVSW